MRHKFRHRQRRSHLTRNPTNPVDEQHIATVASAVFENDNVRVSIENVKLVNSLPTEYAPPTEG